MALPDGNEPFSSAASRAVSTVVIAYPSPLERRQRDEAAAAAARRRRRGGGGGRGASPAPLRAGAAPPNAFLALASAAAALFACGAAIGLARRRAHQHQQQHQHQQLDRRRKANNSSGISLPDLFPPELAAAVPAATLRPLRALLEAVYALRGWRGGGYHYERAWERALQRAALPEGGGWDAHFDARDEACLSRAALRRLGRCLDAEFFGGALHGLLMRRLWEEEEGGGGDDEQKGEKTATNTKKKSNNKRGDDERAAERAAARAAAEVLAAAAAAFADAPPPGEKRRGAAADALFDALLSDEGEAQGGGSSEDEERASREAEAAAIAEFLSPRGPSLSSASASTRRRGSGQKQHRQPQQPGQKGSSHKHQPWRHARRLDYAADPLHWPDAGYVAAYSSSRHVVRVSRRAWVLKRGVVSPERPLNCEGWRAPCLLSALAHSLAHELVHALVAACFPAMELREASYLGTDGQRHGPAFALLNRAIFGHTSPDALAWWGPR